MIEADLPTAEVSKCAKSNLKAGEVAGYIAQVLNKLAKNHEERQLSEDLKRSESSSAKHINIRKNWERRGDRGLKLGPQAFEQLTKRRQFKLYLNPVVYKAFRQQCKIEKRKPNIIVESFMLACLENPTIINLIEHLAKRKQNREQHV